jgi:hypothetical protein
MICACSQCGETTVTVRRLYVRIWDGSFWCGACYLWLWAFRIAVLVAAGLIAIGWRL